MLSGAFRRSGIQMKSKLPPMVRIVEVGPRDGLQNETNTVPTLAKLELIGRLRHAGLKRIEVGSFVSPKWVPQMADTPDIVRNLGLIDKAISLVGSNAGGGDAVSQEANTEVSYSALTPNMQGFEHAVELGIKDVAIFGAASETFSQKNINCSVNESLERFQTVCDAALSQGVRVRGYVSCVLGCPYEGDIAPQAVADITSRLLKMGCYEVSLGDTIGVGTPHSTSVLLDTLQERGVPTDRLAVHFHDTYGMAVANLVAALERGVSVVDSSISGLGGCPYAAGASGNVATEDVVYLLDGLGVRHGVDLAKLLEAQVFIDTVLSRTTGSKVAAALAERLDLSAAHAAGIHARALPEEEEGGGGGAAGGGEGAGGGGGQQDVHRGGHGQYRNESSPGRAPERPDCAKVQARGNCECADQPYEEPLVGY